MEESWKEFWLRKNKKAILLFLLKIILCDPYYDVTIIIFYAMKTMKSTLKTTS